MTGDRPRLQAPAGATDTHMHFYDTADRYRRHRQEGRQQPRVAHLQLVPRAARRAECGARP
jgi:hypothetical protein